MIVFVGDDIEKALQELRKKLVRDGILKEVRLRSVFESPSQKRRRKDRESMRRFKKWRGRKDEYEMRSIR